IPLLVIISVVAAAVANAQQASNGQPATPAIPSGLHHLIPTDIFNFQFAQDPQISPDGRRVVYVRRYSDIMTDSSYSDLWMVNSDGSDERPLTTGMRNDASPRWSPDGTRIAFVSGEGESPAQIYVMWADTAQVARVTSIQNAPGGIAWSPDGKQIAFTAMVPAKPLTIGEM